MRPGHAMAGNDWLGLLGDNDYVVKGIRQTSLMPAFARLLLGLGAVMFAWRREGR